MPQPDMGHPVRYSLDSGVKALIRRIRMNGSLQATSLGQMCDDGEVTEPVQYGEARRRSAYVAAVERAKEAMMDEKEQKAIRLVTDGRVTLDVTTVTYGELVYAAGTVKGDHDLYAVTCSPDGDRCSCPFGIARPGATHSHTTALRLAAWVENREEMQ